MKVVIDIEGNGLTPTHVWVIVTKDLDTGEINIFREVTENEREAARFISFSRSVVLWVGHNFLGYDYPVLNHLVGLDIPEIATVSIDTFICSKLIDYPRKGHSVEDYGIEFNIPKSKFSDYTKYSIELEERCISDVNITEKIYLKYLKYISKEEHKASILLEHQFQLIVNDLHTNGFCFNTKKAKGLLTKVEEDLGVLDKEIAIAFPKKSKLLREITPTYTKFGTINKKDFRWVDDGDLSPFVGPFSRFNWEEFNPSSHKQIIDVLTTAGWSPIDKTDTHKDIEREINSLKFKKRREKRFDVRLEECYTKVQSLSKYGYKINENNLSTLPANAPPSARTLAKRILLEARRRTLTEWLGLVRPETNRIHGRFHGLGAWTHRMAHQQPNTANIPNELDTFGNKKLLGKEMRSLWCAPKNRLLVGVDAEGIQLRIFAHYIDDPEFTDALVKGKKDDKSDPHSLNARILGDVCKSRAAAKRFIYALLLGAGVGKLTEILGCEKADTDAALARLLERYQGFARLKSEVIPSDARKGWFTGLDGRSVKIPGETYSERRHLAMSGYLQNGEAVCMKLATLLWSKELELLENVDTFRKYKPLYKLVNFVHDEWQTECPNDMKIAIEIAEIQSYSLETVGKRLGLKCPLAGSYFNEDLKDYTIATDWSKTH